MNNEPIPPPASPATGSSTPEKPHLVPSALYWKQGARKAQTEGNMSDALMFMENAFNHVENALYAATAERDQATALLAEVQRERDARVLPEDFQRSLDFWTSEEKRMRELLLKSEHERGCERQGATWIQNDLKAERDAALAQVSALKAELAAKWQPIETAPKDGTWVILLTSSGVECGYFGPRFFSSDPGWIQWAHRSDCQEVDGTPTHWMPLPNKP